MKLLIIYQLQVDRKILAIYDLTSVIDCKNDALVSFNAERCSQ